MSNVVSLRPRLLRPRVVRSPPLNHGMEVCTYQRAAIHEGVPIALLVSALTRSGLTLTNLPGHGLVIHRIGQNPERPDSGPLGAS